MVLGGDDEMSVRMPDGKVLLTVPEAAALWNRIGSDHVTADIYRRKCQRGDYQSKGILISEGPRFLTDLDSLLEYLDREQRRIRANLDEALEERRKQLEERG